MGTEERFCSYLDMPLQHSHGEMLAAMRRGGDAKRYLRLLDRARELAPDIFLRSTFIVGFPGETEEHFQRPPGASSRRPASTTSAPSPTARRRGRRGRSCKGGCRSTSQRRRLRQLLEAQRPIALERRQRLVGRRMPVLVEGVCEESEHLLQGRHHGMAPQIDGRVLINDGSAPAGTLALVEITDAYADDLVGHVVGAVRPQDADRVRSPAPKLAAAVLA